MFLEGKHVRIFQINTSRYCLKIFVLTWECVLIAADVFMFVPVFHMDMICVPTPILKTDENDGLELIMGFLF